MSRVRLASGIEIPAKPRSTQVLGHEEHGSPTRTKMGGTGKEQPHRHGTEGRERPKHETRTRNTHMQRERNTGEGRGKKWKMV